MAAEHRYQYGRNGHDFGRFTFMAATEDGPPVRRKVWGTARERTGRDGSPVMVITVLDREGGATDELVLASPEGVTRQPARLSLHYGALETCAAGDVPRTEA